MPSSALTPRRLVWTMFALLPAACSFDAMQAPSMLENRCSDERDCNTGRCAAGMCVADASASTMSITLEVTPASAGYGIDAPTIVLAPLAVRDATERDVLVPDAALVFGDVRVGGTPIAATLRWTAVMAASSAPGSGLSVATAPEPITTAAGDVADYTVGLLQQTTYDLTVTPTDAAQWPPLLKRIETTLDPTQRVDVVYDGAQIVTTSVHVEGLSVGEWTVVAVDPSLGIERSTRVVVSASQPVAELRSVEGLDRFDLVVAPVSVGGERPTVPTFRVPYAALTQVDGEPLVAVLPEVTPAVTVNGSVASCRELDPTVAAASRPTLAVAIRSTGINPVASASAVRASFATATSAVFTPTAREWTFVAKVPTGHYEIIVTPPVDSGCGVFAETRMIQVPGDVASPATAAAFTLPTLSFLSGSVRAGFDEPVTGATVVAHALGLREAIALAPEDGSVTRYNRSQQTTTDPEGMFRLPVDIGAYDVVVRPPADSGYAWQVMRDVNVGARTDTPFERQVELIAPVVLRATLRTGSGADSLAGARVRAFIAIDDAERGTRALHIASATARDDGGFTLLLPPTVDQGWY